jgi:hypothetical protein
VGSGLGAGGTRGARRGRADEDGRVEADPLLPAVEQAFELTSRGLTRWGDPHPPPDRVVADEEYSRVTDPAKWRIIGARVDAWIDVLVAAGAATVERDVPMEWAEPPGPIVTRTDLVRPGVADGLPLVVGRSRIDTVDDAGIVIAVGLPAMAVCAIPDCGCDACDSGSGDVIEQVDTWLGGVVRGELRHLVRSRSTITVISDIVRQASYQPELPTAGDGWWSAAPPPVERVAAFVSGRARRPHRPFEIDAVLADPTGWREWSRPPWLS